MLCLCTDVQFELTSTVQMFYVYDFQSFFPQLEERTLLDFANNLISHQGNSIKSRLDNLHSLVVPEKGGGILGNKGVITMFANGIKVNSIAFNFFSLFKRNSDLLDHMSKIKALRAIQCIQRINKSNQLSMIIFYHQKKICFKS